MGDKEVKLGGYVCGDISERAVLTSNFPTEFIISALEEDTIHTDSGNTLTECPISMHRIIVHYMHIISTSIHIMNIQIIQ